MTIIMMPLIFSVATGKALSFILYPLMLIGMGKFRGSHPIMYVLGFLFVGYFMYV